MRRQTRYTPEVTAIDTQQPVFLPPDVEYVERFVDNPRELFWDLLRDFHDIPHNVTGYAGSRFTALTVRTTELNSITEIMPKRRLSSLGESRWPATTGMLAGMVYAHTKIQPDAVAFNLYRDGDDYIDFHVDPDFMFGPRVDNVVIATVSLGAPRRMGFKRIRDGKQTELLLENGSLVIMRGKLQQQWMHAIEKDESQAPRLSLTFMVAQQDEPEKRSWNLVKPAPKMMEAKNDVQIQRLLQDGVEESPETIFVGDLETVFDLWSTLAKREPEKTYMAMQKSLYQTREDLLVQYPELLERLAEDDPLATTSPPPSEDVDLQNLPTPWLEEMLAKAQVELQSRKGDEA